MGFSRQEYWSGLPFPSPGNLPDTGIKPRSPALQIHSLPTELWGNDILALHIKFTKDICTYKVSGGSSWPLTRLRKKHFSSKELPSLCQKKKNKNLCGWMGISVLSEGWLINTKCRCTVHTEGEEEAQKGRETILCLTFSCLVLKYEFYFINS